MLSFIEQKTVGIDLGTTFSSLAEVGSDGHPVTIPNADGELRTPSTVFLGEEGHVLVGPSFDRLSNEDPSQLVQAIKRQMGNKSFYLVYMNKRLTPEFISALILKKLKQDCEKRIGPIPNAVITVPYDFDDAGRKATHDAGQIAGLNIVDILDEPTAATLAYAWMKGELGRNDLHPEEKTALVYDLGASFHVTVARYAPTTFRVLAAESDRMLGGHDWTRRIVAHFCDEFQDRFAEDPRENAAALRSFTRVCEDAKRQLSTRSEVAIKLDYKGRTHTSSITQGDFERITADLLQQTTDAVVRALREAKVDPGDLNGVIPVGGATAMPAVQEALQRLCNFRPLPDFRPEQAVAQGAAIHAYILERERQARPHLRRWLF